MLLLTCPQLITMLRPKWHTVGWWHLRPFTAIFFVHISLEVDEGERDNKKEEHEVKLTVK